MKRMGIFILLLVLTAIATTASAADSRGLSVVSRDASGNIERVKLYNKTFAVIIGIDRYKNLPAAKQLSFAVGDAKAVEGVLRRNYRFDKIVTLYNEQATRDNIMRVLTLSLPAEMGNQDSLFVFWAGHGNQKKTPDGEIGYLIPYDGNMSSTYGNITMSQIKDDISREIPAKHVFYAMDACYSGLLTTRSAGKAYRHDPSYLRAITKERVRQVLTAGSKGQEVLDNGPGGHSVFTGRLIQILSTAGDYKTANEIQATLSEKVYQDARARGYDQRPDFGILYGTGDYVFIPSAGQKVIEQKAVVSQAVPVQEQIVREEPGTVGSTSFTSPTLGAEFVLIQARTFMMGSPAYEQGRDFDEIRHQVTISKPFYIQTTEVTQEQWVKVMGSNPSNFKECGYDCPVEQVSWNDVQEFIHKLNSMEGGNRYRLPTEAEWEYAARSCGKDELYSGGNDIGEVAWYSRNSNGSTRSVRQKAPNSMGIYDMSGNVWEWCQDLYGDYPSVSETAPVTLSGNSHVCRGGSWSSRDRHCRSSDRDSETSDSRQYYLGFRLAASVE